MFTDYAGRTMYNTPIHALSESLNNNHFYMKRDDLLPFSFGGNKARKAIEYKKDIIDKKATAVVTYGSSESNHCRIISNLCASLNIKCTIISPEEDYEDTNNSTLTGFFGAKIIKTPLSSVSRTIDDAINNLKSQGEEVYFIQGGGHGNLGTAAYEKAYAEIKDYEKENSITFDYIFLPSGTGTTQAGLICGQIKNNDTQRKIIGISIAREKERGEKILQDSIKDFLGADNYDKKLIFFNDEYTQSGYNKTSPEISDTIRSVLKKDGVALNKTYSGKAYYGMLKYIKERNIHDKNILFLNTGGLPLFFDDIKEIIK